MKMEGHTVYLEYVQRGQDAKVSKQVMNIETRDSTGTGTGTVPGWNNVASVRSWNIFFVSELDSAKHFR